MASRDKGQSASSPIIDESEKDTSIPHEKYDITSYGADYDVEGLVNRLIREDILIPPFQRDYVWSIKDASRFIESLLFGLPVPGIFLAKEPDTNKLLVIDGQQRLKSLRYFYDGYFNPKENDKKSRIFKLTGIQEEFEGKTYKDLNESDRINLNDSIIHATIIKQETPENDDTSIYHVFERLNSGGRKLTAQEIRSALYHGSFINLANELNEHKPWRSIFGKPHQRLKDIELIIRFFSIEKNSDNYSKPMSEFLNEFTSKYRNPNKSVLNVFKDKFEKTIDAVYESLGNNAFKLERGVNAAVYDSVMFGLCKRLDHGPINNKDNLYKKYNLLLKNNDYLNAVSQSTADETSVLIRTKLAKEYFQDI